MATAQMIPATPELKRCEDLCLECAKTCLETVAYCLQKGGRHAEAGHIRLLLDCADICQTSAGFMSRRSDLHSTICGACADVCQRCADDCKTFGDDPQMKACAEICAWCAESCRSMAGSHAAGARGGRG